MKRRVLILSLAATLASGAEDTAALRENFAKRPPFGDLSVNKPVTTATSIPPTELRGFFGTGAHCQVSLRRGGPKPESRWLSVGQSGGPWRVLAADTANKTAVVEIDGKVRTLTLSKSDGKPTAATTGEEQVQVGPTPARPTGDPAVAVAPGEPKPLYRKPANVAPTR